MGGFEACKPAMAMVATQFIYAGVSLFTRAALLQGMSPRVFVVYRQAIATLVIAPIAFFSTRREPSRSILNLRSFSLIFLASLIGVTGTQNAYFEGLDMAPSSIAIATTNLIPAVTFLVASIAGIEKVNFRSIRSVAKVVGTAICVTGAICMAIVKGPKLLNSQLPQESLFNSGGENWLVGFLFLFGSCCCWSLWLILQVPITECYPDHLSSSAWMCFFSTLQCATLTLALERGRPEAWILHLNIELASCFYSGVIGSGLAFFLQTWCISQKGPHFSSMFYPLSTVIVTILASLFLDEEIYTGSLIGAVTVIMGLYVVLWGKAEDLGGIQKEETIKEHNDHMILKIDLDEPLLSDNSVVAARVDLAIDGHLKSNIAS